MFVCRDQELGFITFELLLSGNLRQCYKMYQMEYWPVDKTLALDGPVLASHHWAANKYLLNRQYNPHYGAPGFATLGLVYTCITLGLRFSCQTLTKHVQDELIINPNNYSLCENLVLLRLLNNTKKTTPTAF
jgi:hypothetical protein